MCDCTCVICGLSSAVEHNCDCTPRDMTWCECPSHKNYSKLLHINCGIFKVNRYDEIQIYCNECAKEVQNEKQRVCLDSSQNVVSNSQRNQRKG
jgi:hypothetical protein